MKVSIKICFLFINILLAQTVLGQEIQEERIIELSNVNAIPLSLGLKENVSIIQQLGNQNSASIFQKPSGMQSANFSSITQNGNGNQTNINQIGTRLSATNLQSGNNNQSNITATGDQISISANQNGNRNLINTFVENGGLTSRSVLLNQQGNNNQINLEFLNGNFYHSEGLESVRVSQTGNRHGLNLLLDNASSPVEVIQTPGAGGQGMQVNIVTSAFPIK